MRKSPETVSLKDEIRKLQFDSLVQKNRTFFLYRSPADGEVENISASRDSLQTTRSVEFDNPSTRSVEFDNQTTRSVEFDNQTTRSGDSLDFNDRNGRPTRYSGKEYCAQLCA
jgi:hypothetical protein